MKKAMVIDGGAPSVEELGFINQFTRRELTADETYTFSVVLCDNEVDRDFERFTVLSLQKLGELFVGKTGVFDHSMKGKDQTARVFSVKIEQDTSRITQAGEPYTTLKASAYMPRTEKNRDLIEEIEAGIKKEVSVGCAVGKITCSVCGADWKEGGCTHVKGKSYAGKVCHGVLEEPTDAYEWSFVAVPAQRNAGVVKAYRMEGGTKENMSDFVERIRKNGVTTQQDREKLCAYIQSLEKQAVAGETYRETLEEDVLKLSAFALPKLDGQMFESMVKKLEVEELACLKNAMEERRTQLISPVVQLGSGKAKQTEDHSDFKI